MPATVCSGKKRKPSPAYPEALVKQQQPCFFSSIQYVIRPLQAPMVNPILGHPMSEVVIAPGKFYTFGRSRSTCHCVFEDSRVSRQHIQLYLDPSHFNLFVLDGILENSDVHPFGNPLPKNPYEFSVIKYAKPSLNGFYVNGIPVRLGHARSLLPGDKVSLACGCNRVSNFGPAVGFVVCLRKGREENWQNSCRSLLDSLNKKICGESTIGSYMKNRHAASVSDQDKFKRSKLNHSNLLRIDREVELLISRASLLLKQCREMRAKACSHGMGNDETLPPSENMTPRPNRKTSERISTLVGTVSGFRTNGNSKKLHIVKNEIDKNVSCDFKDMHSLISLILPQNMNLCNTYREASVNVVDSQAMQTKTKLVSLTPEDAERNQTCHAFKNNANGKHSEQRDEALRITYGLSRVDLSQRRQKFECQSFRGKETGRKNAESPNNVEDSQLHEKANEYLLENTLAPSVSEKIFGTLDMPNQFSVGKADASNLSISPLLSKKSSKAGEQRQGCFMNQPKRADRCQNDCQVIDSSLKNEPQNVSAQVKANKGTCFYLNKLEAVKETAEETRRTVSLLELMTPIDKLLAIFCATFTVDIKWFMSYCKIPKEVAVTIACHNSKHCWSKRPEERCSKPYSEWPNLTVIYPPFPEESRIGTDQKQGIGCHHPKLILLHYKNFMRVIITSANLGPRQWLSVTNTVWFQDFPLRGSQDFESLFSFSSCYELNKTHTRDFAAQLAGFLAKLIVGVPMEAHWIEKLAWVDFKEAAVCLVTSIPGVHEWLDMGPRPFYESQYSLSRHWKGKSRDFVGTVSTFVVGISYRFCVTADPKGKRLKSLAKLLMNFSGNAERLVPVLLKRVFNIPADPNAVGVIVYNIHNSSDDLPEDSFSGLSSTSCSNDAFVPLGFLPKDIAEWVAPLWDARLFAFYAHVCPQKALAMASGRSSNKVKLILYVFKGENFEQLSTNNVFSKFDVPLCSLLRSLQRLYGLWRLHEILSPYKWPDDLEADFLYGASSIGMSLDFKFLAAFSAASGKRSITYSSSESDPEWGCWDAHLESVCPSIKIVYPTVGRVKCCKGGILAYSRMLCFAQSTWERLKSSNVMYDAIPYPSERTSYPMHVKIARRRFEHPLSGFSFGWIYCGSHNFSPAAWGRPLSSSNEEQQCTNAASVLGSKLQIYNYEIGILFVVSPPDDRTKNVSDLDGIILPFVVPPPQYQEFDEPATSKAIRDARILMHKDESLDDLDAVENLEVEDLDEELPIENSQNFQDFKQEEEEGAKIYAETLWSQLDSGS